ncbi:RNA polymerase sigma factor [Peteryoungia desertarenae]|uniref:RNA polymerase sigma factor n=1 Tax=Peteryoungia desertarenae TaxID=1813451 RepID=A0ABX6QMI6_9HYPH|nr:RNA polymerase sigma factor [Peteryoungia desertarenae]QLF69784.1 RNA polymerase sigma factor [Peteryoungia desertarenae]
MDEPVEIVGKRLVAFLPNLRRFAISLCRARDVADDLVQQTCERALAGAHGFDPDTRFDAWVFKILRNLWLDQLRRRNTAGPMVDLDDVPDLAVPSGEAESDARLALARVEAALQSLAPDQREVLVLVCIEELSYRDAAEVLEIPIGTVMSRLARARKALAELTGINPEAKRSSS